MTNIVKEKKEVRWYALRTSINRERSIKEKILVDFEREKVSHNIKSIIVPTEKYFETKKGKRVTKERVLYPGYILLETSLSGETEYLLSKIKGTNGFIVDREGDPIAMSEKEINRMFGILNTAEESVDNDAYLEGEEVTITDGPFSGFDGTIESVNGNKMKIYVMIFGRKTMVDLTSSQVDRKN